METRALVLFAAAAAAAVVAAPRASAADDVPSEVKDQIAYFEKYVAKAKDDAKYAQLVHDLASCGHPAAAARIARILATDKNPEHVLIAADVLSEFRKDPGRAAAGKALAEALPRAEDEDVQIAILDSLGKLPYAEACAQVSELMLKADSPWLTIRCVRALGGMKDLRALPALLEMLERLPPGAKWGSSSGSDEVVVDTGAAGDADQKEAERQWKEKHAGDKAKKGRKPMNLRVYMQEAKATVHKITNDATIDSAKSLRAWMVAHVEDLTKLGIEIPKYKGPSQRDEKK